MAPARLQRVRNAPSIADNESDYGSDFGTDDEAALSALLTQADSQTQSVAVLETVEEHDAGISQPYQSYVDEEGVVFQVLARDGPIRVPSVEVEYDTSNRLAFSRKSSLFSLGFAFVHSQAQN